MLPDVPAGVSPAGEDCPVATVVILGGGKGDRPVGSPGVHVSGGHARAGSDPSREASNPTGRSEANQDSPENAVPREADRGALGSAESLANGRRPASSVKELGTCSRRTPRSARTGCRCSPRTAAAYSEYASVAPPSPPSIWTLLIGLDWPRRRVLVRRYHGPANLRWRCAHHG